MERVQRQLAAVDAAAHAAPLGVPREEGPRPHGLTRVCSLGSRSADDAPLLTPVDEAGARPWLPWHCTQPIAYITTPWSASMVTHLILQANVASKFTIRDIG